MKSKHQKQRNYKVGAAALGAGVLVAMGAITAAGSGDATNLTEPTTGETSTQTTAPKSPETTKATPPVTASTSEGEWAPMPEVPEGE